MRLAGGTFTGVVIFTGDNYNVTWDKSTDDLIFNDSARAIFGTNSDGLEIFHESNNSYISDTGTGGLILLSNGTLIETKFGAEHAIKCTKDGSVELFHDNVKKFETTANGSTVTGTLYSTEGIYVGDSTDSGASDYIAVGTGKDLKLYHDGNNSKIINSTGSLTIHAKASETGIDIKADGAVELFYNNVKTFETIATGATITSSAATGITFTKPSGSAPQIQFRANSVDAASEIKVSESLGGGILEVKTKTTGGALTTALTLDTSQNATFAGTVTTAGIDIDGQYQQAVDAITPATTPTVNCALGNFFTLNAASTFPSSGWSFTNVPASCVYSVIIKVTTGGSTTINWNSVAVNGGSASNKIKWNGGAVPAFTAGSPLYIILTTTDTGATWEGTSLIDFATV